MWFDHFQYTRANWNDFSMTISKGPSGQWDYSVKFYRQNFIVNTSEWTKKKKKNDEYKNKQIKMNKPTTIDQTKKKHKSIDTHICGYMRVYTVCNTGRHEIFYMFKHHRNNPPRRHNYLYTLSMMDIVAAVRLNYDRWYLW